MLGATPLLSRAELARALRALLFAERDRVPGLDEPSRLLATGVRRNGRPAVLVVGATLQDRAETLGSFRDELLIAGPVALLLATRVGYLLAGLSLRPVDAMRRRAAEIPPVTPGERLPVPRDRRRAQRLGETLNAMLDRLEAGLERSAVSSPTPGTSCARRSPTCGPSSSSRSAGRDARGAPRGGPSVVARRSSACPSSPRSCC